MPLKGSPAIDVGNSGVPNGPARDFAGSYRSDDPGTPDVGAGPLTFADIGALEYVEATVQDWIDLPLPPLTPGGRRAAVRSNQSSGSAGVLAPSTGFPNPSRVPVEVALDLSNEARVEWTVFGLQSRMVWSAENMLTAGRRSLGWDGTIAGRGKAPTGICLGGRLWTARMSSDGSSASNGNPRDPVARTGAAERTLVRPPRSVRVQGGVPGCTAALSDYPFGC